MYYTEKEIMGQHIALQKTVDCFDQRAGELRSFFQGQNRRRFVFLGCGSSYMLAKSAALLFKTRPGITATAIAGGDYIVRPETFQALVEGADVVAISRSGKTSEILRAVELCRQVPGTRIIALTQQEASPLDQAAQLAIRLPWAYDESVCQTRSVTNFYAAELLLSAVIFDDEDLLKAVKEAVRQNESYKTQYRAQLETIAGRDFNNVVVLADGPLCGLAEEGALAFTEIAMIGGSYSNMLDYRHGPIVLNGSRTLTILLLQQSGEEYQAAMVRDVKARGGIVVTIGEGMPVSDVDLHVTLDGIGRFEAMGISFIFVAQMIALAKALKLGMNPDLPASLNAYITL